MSGSDSRTAGRRDPVRLPGRPRAGGIGHRRPGPVQRRRLPRRLAAACAALDRLAWQQVDARQRLLVGGQVPRRRPRAARHRDVHLRARHAAEHPRHGRPGAAAGRSPRPTRRGTRSCGPACRRRWPSRPIERQHDVIPRLVLEVIEPLGDGGTFDFAEAMLALPMAVGGTSMGLPRADWPRLGHLLDAVDRRRTTRSTGPPAARRRRWTARTASCSPTSRTSTATAARNLGDDLVSVLITTEVDGRTHVAGRGHVQLLQRAARRRGDHAALAELHDGRAHRRRRCSTNGRRDPERHADRGRGGAAAGLAGQPLHALRGRRHRGPRHAIKAGRRGGGLARLGQPRRGGLPGRRRRSTCAASPTSTWRSASGRTTASATRVARVTLQILFNELLDAVHGLRAGRRAGTPAVQLHLRLQAPADRRAAVRRAA